eukprot:scpid88360/ scgid3631/ 
MALARPRSALGRGPVAVHILLVGILLFAVLDQSTAWPIQHHPRGWVKGDVARPCSYFHHTRHLLCWHGGDCYVNPHSGIPYCHYPEDSSEASGSWSSASDSSDGDSGSLSWDKPASPWYPHYHPGPKAKGGNEKGHHTPNWKPDPEPESPAVESPSDDGSGSDN